MAAVTVGRLIELLGKLPPESKIYTAGLEGIHFAELGNIFPLKVMQSKDLGCALFIDDGLEDHGRISEAWQPLDEFVLCPNKTLQ
jgi:hypothetical protein